MEKPVNVRTQVILGFFPLLCVYAFYRIDKIFHGLAIIIGVSLVVFITTGIIMGGYMVASNSNFEDFTVEEENSVNAFGSFFAYLISTGFAINFLRRWSIQWNEQILNS